VLLQLQKHSHKHLLQPFIIRKIFH